MVWFVHCGHLRTSCSMEKNTSRVKLKQETYRFFACNQQKKKQKLRNMSNKLTCSFIKKQRVIGGSSSRSDTDDGSWAIAEIREDSLYNYKHSNRFFGEISNILAWFREATDNKNREDIFLKLHSNLPKTFRSVMSDRHPSSMGRQ